MLVVQKPMQCFLKIRIESRWRLLHHDSWFCLNLDSSVRTAPLPEYTHFAFGISKEDFSRVAKRIVDSGAIILKENRSEGDSLYFLDTDNHKLELHVGNLQTRMASVRAKPWSRISLYKNQILDILKRHDLCKFSMKTC